MHRKLAALMLGLTLFGCAPDDAQTSDEASESSSALVVHHSAVELSSLRAGQLLDIDLRESAAIHVVEFARREDLAKVRVTTAEDSFLLDEIAPSLREDQHTVVVGLDQAAINLYSGGQGTSIVIGSDVALQARIKQRTCDGCEDPTGIGPVVCDSNPPRCTGD